MKLKFIEAAHQEIEKEKSKADHPNSRTAKARLKLKEESQSNRGSEVMISNLIGGITVKKKKGMNAAASNHGTNDGLSLFPSSSSAMILGCAS